MPITIEPANDNDIPRVFDIISTTFQHTQPFIEALFPHHDTPRGRALGTARLLQTKQKNPSLHILKAVDSATGAIVGNAHWLVLREMPSEEELRLEGDFWDNEEEKEFSRMLWDQLMGVRWEAVRGAGGKMLGAFYIPFGSFVAFHWNLGTLERAEGLTLGVLSSPGYSFRRSGMARERGRFYAGGLGCRTCG